MVIPNIALITPATERIYFVFLFITNFIGFILIKLS